MYKGNPRLSHEAEAEQSVTEHTLSSALMTEAVGLALASKWHDFGWRPTRRPGTRTGPKPPSRYLAKCVAKSKESGTVYMRIKTIIAVAFIPNVVSLGKNSSPRRFSVKTPHRKNSRSPK